MGKIATQILASGSGWTATDIVCSAGPQDRPFEERHDFVSVSVVLSGSFQYRSVRGSELMTPGSLLLANYHQHFECGHEHGTGDHCLAFHYAPEFFDRAGITAVFPVHRLPPMSALAPWIVEARLAAQGPERVAFEELAHGLADAALQAVETSGSAQLLSTTAADERRISTVLRYVETHLGDPLPLERLAAMAKMSEFHFLRVFKQVTQVTPHHYILRARLREAALRLRTSAEPVLDIALDAGFRDLSNFNHAFRAEFGVNPARFRQATVTTR